jgi:mono/diheme cytochrome c family protein
MLLTAVLAGAVFCPSVFAQTRGKEPNAKPVVTVSAADQTAFGKDLFRQHCASCHFPETSAQKIGPGLKGMYARPFSDGKKVTDAGLTKWIEEGGKNMPGFKETMSPEQVRALIAYIKTL